MRLPKFFNLFLLIGAYGVGQGSLFLSQTWLVSTNHLARLAEFGVSFYFSTLAVMLVDFGGTSFLSRETSFAASTGGVANTQWLRYWELVPIRLAISLAIVLTILIFNSYLSPFSRNFMLWASPAFLLWTFNVVGVLDGLRMSGVSGSGAAFPFVTVAVSLYLGADEGAVLAGALCGAAMTLGYAACLLVHLTALRVAGANPKLVRPSAPGMRSAFVHSGSAMLTQLPGQIYFRLQLALSGALLPQAATALFIYAKQIVAAFAQIIGFMRRIEFPDLVEQMARPSSGVISSILRAQRLGTLTAAISTACVLFAGLSFDDIMPSHAREAGTAIAIFSPTILTSAIALSVMQGLMATKQFKVAAALAILATLAASAFSIFIMQTRALWTFALADVIANSITVCIGIYLLKANRSKLKILP